jgi:catechol 2,3-dioxygenase-like lactoylglutathione lyase family enzyme
VVDPEAGARSELTIWVDEADAGRAELEACGVELLNGPIDRERRVRTAYFTDPVGNVCDLAQRLSNAEES